MSFKLASRIEIRDKYSNLDYLYGPYEADNELSAIQVACNSIEQSRRARGLTVGIISESGNLEEYWWKNGILDEDLEKKIESIISSGLLIIPSVLNYVDSPGTISFLVLYESRAGGRITIYRNGLEIDNLSILPGLNTYYVNVPEEYNNYVYSISLRDIFGLNIDLEVNSFTIKVGSIKIKTTLQNLLNSEILKSSIDTYLTVQNSGDPCSLYFIDENNNRTQIPGTNFNSYFYTFLLSNISGQHHFGLIAYSIKDGQEDLEDYDYEEFTYIRLKENINPYNIVIDKVDNVTTVEKIPVSFHYLAYDSVLKQITFIIDGTTEIIPETYFASFAQCRYSINAISLPGNHTLKLKIGDIESNTYSFVINQYLIDENIVPGSVFLFDAVLSEISGDYTLQYSGFSEGVNGIIQNENLIKFSGESYGILKSNGLPLNPFTLSLFNGATLEVLYNTKCIGNLRAPVLTTFLNSIDTSLGVEVTYKQISVGLGGAARYTVDVSEDTWIHATIVFSTVGFNDSVEETINSGYMYIYINGCAVLVELLNSLPSANMDSFLSLNVDNSLTDFGECNIKLLRFYNQPLSPALVVQNYINSIDDITEREKIKGKNQLNLPTVTFTEKQGTEYRFDDLLKQIDKSKQKKELVKCITEFSSGDDSEPIIWDYTTVATQGTSTLLFPIKNFKIKIYNDDGYKSKKYVSFNSTEGWDEEYVFTLKCDYMESSHLNNTPTCTFFNNMIDSLIDDLTDFPEWTYDSVSPARAGYINSEGEFRTYFNGEVNKRGYLDAIKGFPCVVKYVDLNNETHYLGTYMFNLDKEAKSLGFEAYNKNNENVISESQCISIEGKSNTDEGAGSFCSFDYWLRNKSGYNSATGVYSSTEGYYATEYNDYYLSDKNVLSHTLNFNSFIQYFAIDNPGEDFYSEIGNVNKRHLISVSSQDSYYNLDFETRYIYNEDYETKPTNWHNWRNVVDFISGSYEIATNPNATSEQILEIKNQFLEYFSLNYCLLYYLLMITFAQVDNAGKNCMWDTWDGIKWYPRPYDQDTMAGLDNSGLEIIDPDVEYNMEGSPGNWYKSSASLIGASIFEDIRENEIRTRRYSRFNTSGSRMWVLFKILFDSEIKSLYRRLRNKGIYDINNIINFYFSLTSDIIGETYYNKDSVNKFIQPIGGNQYLALLHGNRRERFKYWITNRIKFCDSLFEYNRTDSELINLRINPNNISELVFKVYNPIYIHIIVGTITGSGLEADVEYNFYCSPESLYEAGKEGVKISIPITSGDKEVSIFGASSIKEIEGLSQLNCKLINLSRASKITTLELIGLKNLTSLVLGNNEYLQTIVAEGLTGIKNELNLTGASNIKSVSLRGSTFNNLNLTTLSTGTTVKIVDISNTSILNLYIKQAPFLQVLNVDGCDLLASLELDNCNIQSIAFSSLSSLKTLKLINCKYLRTVNISLLSYFELDTLNFYNCPMLEEIIMTGVHNVGNSTKVLSLESITSLKVLNLQDTEGIEQVHFDTDKLLSLLSINLRASLITRLDLPSLSTLTYLNCYNCTNLTRISGLNANLSLAEVFTNCKTLISILGTYLKNTNAARMFLGCYVLDSLDIETIDFSQNTSFVGTFSRCHKLPWTEIKKVLVCNNSISAHSIFAYRYHDPSDTSLGIVPSDIFDGIPNVNNLQCAFGYGSHSNDIYVNGHSTPSSYTSINTIQLFNTTLSNVTNINYFALNSRITAIPNLSKLPNITTALGAFMSCSQLTTIPQNVFASNTSLTDVDVCFDGCSGLTCNVSNILDPLSNLTSARGLFYNSSIKGVVPKGFLKNNHVLTNTTVMFAGSKITGLSPLFLNNNDEVEGTYVLNSINAMFSGCTSLTGDIPEDLFTGCSTIRSAGAYTGSLPNHSSITQRGLFYNTLIQNVPQSLFDSLKNVTTALGMFFNCKLADFPKHLDEVTYEPTYLFLNGFTQVTNLNLMFTGCTEFKQPIVDNFIPSTATEINGIFAFTGIPNVISLLNLTNLTTAVGAWANTPVEGFPRDEFNKINLFKGLSLLRDVKYFFRGCINFDDYLDSELFEDCTSLVNTSYMFSYCESLGENKNAKNTILEGLFRNNLLLESTAYMFNYCINLNGTILNMFENSEIIGYDEQNQEDIIISKPYTKLYNIDHMFSYSNSDTDENGYAFSNDIFENLTNVTSANFLFGGFNRTSGRSKARVPYKLAGTIPLIWSTALSKAEGIFSNSNLIGQIDKNIFRPSLNSLENIKEAFYNTGITSIPSDVFFNTSENFNRKLSNVSNAFRSTGSLSSDIPQCNNNTMFRGIKNTVSTYQGYAAGSSASNVSTFTGTWVDSSSSVSIAGPGSHNKKSTLDLYTNQTGLIGL